MLVRCRWSEFRGGSTPRIADIVIVNSFFLQETEHVVENIVAVSLTSEEETLGEFSPGTAEIRHFADDEDSDTTISGRLGINRMDEDFAVLETHGDDFVVNVQLTVAGLSILSFDAMDESGGFRVKTVQAIGLFVENSVIFCNELPTNF